MVYYYFALLIAIQVVAARIQECEGSKQWLQQVHQERQQLPRLVCIWVDGGFSGADCWRWVMETFCLILKTVLRPQTAKGFVRLLKRWGVERTYGWLHWCHRLNVDYERLPESSEAFIHIAMIPLR
ncbi:MAG: transposase [Synechococcales cyanobacterium M58_A2018_015]|nr:transposase [Synechococcales cyanobacterium M58_A2018_015]